MHEASLISNFTSDQRRAEIGYGHLFRDDLVPAASGLERTRSGWIKAPEEFTSLRSLHVAQTPHMGVSIPAVSYRLRADGSADTDNKPQPVTLFFGIIDFLQVYQT